jgi:hypothetical protein
MTYRDLFMGEDPEPTGFTVCERCGAVCVREEDESGFSVGRHDSFHAELDSTPDDTVRRLV